MTNLLLALCIAGLFALWAITERRHRRTRRRLADLTSEVRACAARTDRVERHAYAARAEAALRSAGAAARFPVRFVSQFGEDAFIFDLFDGKPGGVFVEAGAFDGVLLSTTYALEAMGWTGLLVEPIPERFEACRAARPGSRVVRAAVGRAGSTGVTRFEVPEADPAALADLGASMAMPEHQRREAARLGASVRMIEVPLTSLGALLDEAPPAGRIDVAVIDVEGFEADAIDGLDLGRYRPRTLIVEDLVPAGDARTAGVLAAAGYAEVVRLGHNRVWVDAREPALLARARMLAMGGAVKEGVS
jgi:FkbM family methyltransferase